jgi:hypothetical protein
MEDFTKICKSLGVLNLDIVSRTPGIHRTLVRALEDAQTQPKMGYDSHLFLDIDDPSIQGRAHLKLFLPATEPLITVKKGEALMVSIRVTLFINCLV